MVAPESKPLWTGKGPDPLDRDFAPETSTNPSGNATGNLDESTVLALLNDLIASGDHRLDPMLATITDAARQLTGASGAALAMWKDGAMVCRARSGETAPALGARLNAETGISGECLRTGKIQHCTEIETDPLVDVEVCRSLGLRSIVVLPIQGWRGVNGILEIFSTQAAAFTEAHIALLQQLAALAEQARASQPRGASSVEAKPSFGIEKPAQASGGPLESDGAGEAPRGFAGTRSRPLVLGVIAVLAIGLLAVGLWLGRRGPDVSDAKARAATPSSSLNAASVGAATAGSAAAHPPDNDPVWKVDPGGESLVPLKGAAAAGTPVKFASKVDLDVVVGKKAKVDRSLADRSPSVGNVASRQEVTDSQIGLRSNAQSGDATSAEPLAIAAGSSSQSGLNGVLSAKISLPGLSAPVSRGISGGKLVSRVPPVYPAQALRRRLEGNVILAAMVMEDGTVRDVKVVEGAPVFAEAAVNAVEHWQYKPFALDGKPVKHEIRINVEFKLP